MHYVERNVLSKKLKINAMAHRLRIVDGLKALAAEQDDDGKEQQSADSKSDSVQNVNALKSNGNVLKL